MFNLFFSKADPTKWIRSTEVILAKESNIHRQNKPIYSKL